jgi:sRNA-binding regulator protein Hfq
MPEQPASRRKASKQARTNYAIESEVDRTIREQNRFLDHCEQKRVELTVSSVTGASFNGIVHNHDRETILSAGSGKNASPRLINKRFVAMIIPREAINLFLEYKGLGTARSKKRKKRYLDAIQKMNAGTDDAPTIA